MLTEDFSSAASSSSSSSSPGPDINFHHEVSFSFGQWTMSNGHPLTFEFAEVKSFVLRSKLDGLSKEELDVESVDLNFPVRAIC